MTDDVFSHAKTEGEPSRLDALGLARMGKVERLKVIAASMGTTVGMVYRVERIMRDAPDLGELVASGELSPSAAERTIRERDSGSRLTKAQQGRAAQADRLAMRLIEVTDDWLTKERAARLIDLWVLHGDG